LRNWKKFEIISEFINFSKDGGKNIEEIVKELKEYEKYQRFLKKKQMENLVNLEFIFNFKKNK
jgi:hypothetical protein